MKKGSYYFGLLTEEEKELYKIEVERCYSEEKMFNFDKLMGFEFLHFNSFILWSFTWSFSIKGYTYWQNIANSNRENIEG